MTTLPYAVAVGSWLPGSETFIYDQLVGADRYHPFVLARDLVPSRLLFPFDRVTALTLPELWLYYTTYRAPRFERALKERGARLIHAHFGTNGALIAPTAGKLGIPLVTTLHGIDVGVLLGQIPLKYRFYAKSYRRMFEESRLLLPASQELADRLVDLGAPPEKILIHRLGVDLKQLKPVVRPDRPVRFLMIGRMVEKKGFEYGIEAFSRIVDRFPGAVLRLIGNGPLSEDLKLLAERLGVGQQVEFAGALPREAVAVELERADVLVAPSVVAANNDRDSGLIVLKEAGATAMPSVGTVCGGLPEIIDDGESGYLVPQRDTDRLAEAMEALAVDHSLRTRMGEAARLKMEREYDQAVQNRKLEELFDRAIG